MRISHWPSAAFGAALVLLGAAGPAQAWGPEAHRAVALIADRLLQQSDPAAYKKLHALLATDKANGLTRNDIASEATWADMLRQKSEEARLATKGWHATRLKPDKPDLGEACFGRKPLPEGYPASHGPAENCSVDKVEQFQKELADPETTSAERLAAVRYLLNLVADLHDPLLVIDRGGEDPACIALQIGTKPPVRLASYWQSTLVNEAVGGNPAQGAAKLAAAAGELKAAAGGTPEAWAQDTLAVAKSVTYAFETGQPAGKSDFTAPRGQAATCTSGPVYKVDAEYGTKAEAATRQLLVKAGIRLAAVLAQGFK